MLIRRALTGLLCDKPIESITIKELCNTAGINRGTFYAHYSDIYELRDLMEQEMMDGFTKSLSGVKNLGKADPTAVTAQLFQCIKDNSDICAVTLGKYGDKDFMMKLINIGRDFCLESYSKFFVNATPRDIEYYYVFVSSGFIGILQRWFADGMAMPSEELVRIAESIMVTGIGFFNGK